jgi:hypothetical protein
MAAMIYIDQMDQRLMAAMFLEKVNALDAEYDLRLAGGETAGSMKAEFMARMPALPAPILRANGTPRTELIEI